MREGSVRTTGFRAIPADRIKRLRVVAFADAHLDPEDSRVADDLVKQAAFAIASKLMEFKKVLVEHDDDSGMTLFRFSIEVIVPKNPGD